MNIFNRTDLAKYFKELGFKVGAEIGVDAGAYSEILCKENPGLKLYCIDYWGLKRGGLGNHRARVYLKAKKSLSLYNATLIQKYSLDAVNDFEDGSLDFVYLDAGHFFNEVIQDLIRWIKKVRKGGIVSGHDYVPSDAKRVATAVDAYVKAHNLRLCTTKDPNEPASWWFLKKWNT